MSKTVAITAVCVGTIALVSAVTMTVLERKGYDIIEITKPSFKFNSPVSFAKSEDGERCFKFQKPVSVSGFGFRIAKSKKTEPVVDGSDEPVAAAV